MTTLLIRATKKVGRANAKKQPMKDSRESLCRWVQGMNETVGWEQYAVLEAPDTHGETIVDAGSVNDGVVEPE